MFCIYTICNFQHQNRIFQRFFHKSAVYFIHRFYSIENFSNISICCHNLANKNKYFTNRNKMIRTKIWIQWSTICFFKYEILPKCNDNGLETLHCFRDLDLKEDELDDKSNEIGRLRDSINDIETRWVLLWKWGQDTKETTNYHQRLKTHEGNCKTEYFTSIHLLTKFEWIDLSPLMWKNKLVKRYFKEGYIYQSKHNGKVCVGPIQNEMNKMSKRCNFFLYVIWSI